MHGLCAFTSGNVLLYFALWMKFVIPGIPKTFEFLNSGKVTTGRLPCSSVEMPAVEVSVSCTSEQNNQKRTQDSVCEWRR